MKLFTVVGMHRSGTSVIARGLNMLGASLGPESDLMPAKPDNPEGFWESLSVTQLHDDLFAFMERRWDHPPVMEDGWENDAILDDFVARIHALVDSHFADAETALWKDPRGSFFMPLWRRAVPVAGTIHCLRHPDDVARSLHRRERLSSEFSAALWLRHVMAAYHDNAGALLVPFDAPYEAPDEILSELAGFVGFEPPSEKQLQEFRRYVKPELRHFSPHAPRPGRLLQLARAMFTILTTQPREVASPLVEALTDRSRLERYMDDQWGEMRAYRDLIGPSVVDLLREVDRTREPA